MQLYRHLRAHIHSPLAVGEHYASKWDVRQLIEEDLTDFMRADLCINMEHSNNTIANVCVGIVMVRIRVEAPELFFRYSAEAKAQYWNPIEQLCEVIRRIGPSLDPIPEGGWMTFTPHPALPDDTRIWAALIEASGGVWGGCVYDAKSIVGRLLHGGKTSS